MYIGYQIQNCYYLPSYQIQICSESYSMPKKYHLILYLHFKILRGSIHIFLLIFDCHGYVP